MVTATAAAVSLPMLPAAAAAPTAASPTAASPSAASASAAGRTASSPLGTATAPTKPRAQRNGAVPGQVLVTLDDSTRLTGTPVAGKGPRALAPDTSRPQLDQRLSAVRAVSLRPVLAGVPAAQAAATGLGHTYVLSTRVRDAAEVARRLDGAPGVVSVEPNRYVNTMDTGGQPLTVPAPKLSRGSSATEAAGDPQLPDNYAVSSSAQALLNSGGVDAMGAYADLQSREGQDPGAGEIITNVSIGDLTDQSMADAGDGYVQQYGPTTILQGGQRYLDLPSMPLIPTYVAGPDGSLSGTASTEDQDPTLGEIMLDFGVMAPLPHDEQRPDALGSQYTDLLGIAPGASYRLVVPQQPTLDQIGTALLAAANQTPRPDVITASLGVGTDEEGFPGRYLEDDPVIHAIVDSIVRSGVVVVISSNDGTRLYTPAAVGPDGGSTPTDLAAKGQAQTTIDDDAESTTPSVLSDSGAIAAGGTTLDDTLAQGADGPATVAETRISGFGTFSSGFGSRVDLSAPSDNVLSFEHSDNGGPQDVGVTLNGGTSASAPEIAAAAADLLQAARLAHHPMNPAQVRSVLEQTGRTVATPGQIDQPLHVGRQIDVTAAVEHELGTTGPATPHIVRLGVEHRVVQGGLGGEFLEATDPSSIDLGDQASGGDGEGLVGPVTFAGDVTGLDGQPATYELSVGSTVWRSDTPALRVTPTQLLTAAGLPVVSTSDRTVTVTYSVVRGSRTLASTQRTLTVGPSDGTYAEGLAPKAPAVVQAGRSVTVSYDLTGVDGVNDPYLVVSTVGHWNPDAGPIFTPGWSQELTDTSGTVTIPASAFDGGGGLYGIGVATSGFGGNPARIGYTEFAPIRVDGGTAAQRPVAPLLTGGAGAPGHVAEVTRAKPAFSVGYDVSSVPGAHAAEVEVSTPAPTLRNSDNTFTNANGTQLDNDGVDSPSVAHRVLTGTHGVASLDAVDLGLVGSDQYGVRVLALDGAGHVVGQASPVSTLYFDDGLPPAGSSVLSFGIDGSHSIAALQTAAGGTQIAHYDSSTGAYGAVIASDASADDEYEVIGVSDDRALLLHQQGDAVSVETWNTTTDTEVGHTVLDGTYKAGKVDPVNDTGDVLVRRSADGADTVLPINLSDGTAAAAIVGDPTGVAAGTYSLLEIDDSTGLVYLAKAGAGVICFGATQVARVDPATGTVGSAGSWSGCSHGFASDDAGSLYNVSASSFSVNIVPTSVLTSMDAATGTIGSTTSLEQVTADALAVDGVHHLAVVSFNSPAGQVFFGNQGPDVPDNNATGQLLVVDLTTGTIVKKINGVIMGAHGGPLLAGGQNGSIQLDPQTRTGWTYAAGNGQIQQFSY